MARHVTRVMLIAAGIALLGMFAGASLTAQSSRRPTRTTVSAAPSPSVQGQAVTLTATVQAAGSGAAPVGGVEFYAGAKMLGAATLPAQGATRSATLEIDGLPAGHHQLTARYMGHPDFLPSVSPPIGHTVNAQ